MLAESQFQLLNHIRRYGYESQRQLAKAMGMSVGKINQTVNKMRADGLLHGDFSLTQRGMEALAPYKVQNAVIMAAGMSSRFIPLSYEKPKGLLTVKGEVLIERQIRQLREAGISDITVVVGYLKEQFFYLEEAFDVKIVVNEDYYRYNNTSTLIRVADKLDNTYVCSSDNYFVENPFEDYVYKAYYPAVYSPGATDEYCIRTDASGRITHVTVGGEAAWYMIGHVYFDRAFSSAFAPILAEEYRRQLTKTQLWEDLYIRYIDRLDMVIRKCEPDSIKEFDSIEELRQFDPYCPDYVSSSVYRNISQVLNVPLASIGQIEPIKTGITNSSFSFVAAGQKYVYRRPGVGTEKYINRHSEARSLAIAKRLGLDHTFIYMDETEGWKISRFIDHAATLDYHDRDQVRAAMELVRTLHDCGERTEFTFDIWKECVRFEDLLRDCGRSDFSDMDQLHRRIERLHALADGEGFPECLCHCDTYDPNFLVDRSGHITLIDWEYSGMAQRGGDLGTFIACSDYTAEEALSVIDLYLGHKADDRELRYYISYVAIAAYYWFLWAIYQESVQKNVGEYLYIWYRYTKKYSDMALQLYQP